MMKALIVEIALVLGCVVSAADDIVKVKGVGTGETEEAALKDAYRDAVESAVGMYVDAEQAAKNDEVIKDEILTQSNAYIEDYDEIEKKKESGLFKIKILARVKRQEITKRLSGTMKAKTVKVGGGLKNLHAQMTTGEKKANDGAALLRQALEGVDPLRQLMEVSLVTGEAVPVPPEQGCGYRNSRSSRIDDDTVEVAYLFKFEINRERYFKEFLPNLEQVLTQVSETEPQELSVSSKVKQTMALRNDSLKKCLQPEARQLRNYLTHGEMEGERTLESSAFGRIDGVTACLTCREEDPLDVILVTEANATMSAIRGKSFSLDAACAKVVYAFENGDAAGDAKSRSRRDRSRARSAGTPVYVVSFLDADGKMLVSQEIDIGRTRSTMRGGLDCVKVMHCYPAWAKGSREMRNNRCWFVSPFIGGNAMAYYQWFSFKIPKDDLPKVDSIKIELAK